MRVYVPSRGRAGNINSQECTATLIRNATYVVPSDEVSRYERALNQRQGTFEVLPCDADGISKTRLWIGSRASDRGESSFAMLDDDLMFCVRKGPDNTALRKSNAQDVENMLTWTAEMLKSYAHVSVSTRQGNNNIGVGTAYDLLRRNTRTLRYLCYQTDRFLDCEHGRVPVMEDFDVNLQLLRKGLENITTFWWSQDQRATGSAGGCSAYRTLDLQDAAARRLMELHPDFVKLRTKVNKTGHLRERTEVTIQWAKAFESGHQWDKAFESGRTL